LKKLLRLVNSKRQLNRLFINQNINIKCYKAILGTNKVRVKRNHKVHVKYKNNKNRSMLIFNGILLFFYIILMSIKMESDTHFLIRIMH